MNNKYPFPKIMGIVNVTPDSFSDGGVSYSTELGYKKAIELIEQGADIVDIGGETTKQGTLPVSLEDELARVLPVVKKLKALNPKTKISVDTTKYEVARQSLEAGADYINDISGLNMEPRFAELSGEFKVPLIIMHMQGVPRTMQTDPQYVDVVKEVYDELAEKIKFANSHGAYKVIADVGIGFGKTVEHNWTLLRNHRVFENLGVELLLGISRKSFIGKTFGIDQPIDRDTETAIIHSLLTERKIDYIRVHNVALHKKLKDIYLKLL